MILYGGGGHALVVYDAIVANQFASSFVVSGYFDDNEQHTTNLPLPYLGKYSPNVLPTEPIVIAIGNNQIREKIGQSIKHPTETIIHPTAVLPSLSAYYIGTGSMLLARVIVNPNSQIGKHVILNTGCIIEHDCLIEDFVHIAPGAILCGNVYVGKGTLIGAGAVVEKGLQIGQNSIIAAGSVITKNIPANVVVMGVPGKVVRENLNH
ncbi:MAG: acetyltransferase, partial [Bacteroidia bacterium]|nr:acetyltransferase [Bacteroidia bacterium]